MNFSAKQLLTSSCMKLKFLRDNQSKKPSPSSAQIDGINHQHKLMTKFNVFGEELGGVFNYDDISIYFSNDIVCYDKIIEIKQVNGQYEDWFLKNSMLQCALYCSFIRLGSNYLTTSNFFLKEGNDKKSIIVNPNIDYFLQFGNKLYKINVYNPTMIVNFFLNKAIASLDYESAKQFDNLYKHNEFELLKKYFRVERCYEKI